MALFTTLTALSQTAGANPPDGSSDAPSTIPTDLRLLGSFAALLRDAAHVYVSSVSGTNTITGSIASNPTSYTVGQVYRFVAAADNTGSVTLNFNSLGAKNLLKVGNVALTGGELQATRMYEAAWDGVSFQLVGMYGFKNSIATNGYQYLPSGLVIQWGTGTLPNSGTGASSVAITLPLAWPAGLLAALATANSGANTVSGGIPTMGATNNTASTITFTGDTLGFANFNHAITFQWVALGH